MRCADCPDLANGTRKRAVCCLRDGRQTRARGERVIIDDPWALRQAADEAIAQSRPKVRRSARLAAMGGTSLESGMAVHPQWVSQDVRS